jgi:hypothetical protein
VVRVVVVRVQHLAQVQQEQQTPAAVVAAVEVLQALLQAA